MRQVTIRLTMGQLNELQTLFATGGNLPDFVAHLRRNTESSAAASESLNDIEMAVHAIMAAEQGDDSAQPRKSITEMSIAEVRDVLGVGAPKLCPRCGSEVPRGESCGCFDNGSE